MSKNIIVPQIPIAENHATAISRIYVGIVASHALAAHHLLDLVKVNSGMVPIMLSDGEREGANLPANGRVVILVDLCGLALPFSEYLDTFSAAIPGCVFLALDRARDSLDIARLLRAGASGFITHSEALYLLGDAINAVTRGNVWTSPEVLRIYVNLTSRRSMADGAGNEMLTVRECQILDLLRERYSNKEVAGLLRISESTVKFHISNIFMKLNVSKRRELTKNEMFKGPRLVLPIPAKKLVANAKQST